MTSTQVGSVTSADVWCATASCRVGSKGSPFSPNADQAELAGGRGQRLGHRGERTDQVAVLAGPVDVVEHRQQRGEHRTGGLLGGRTAVTVDPLAVVGVLRASPAAGRASARRARSAAPPARRRGRAPAALAAAPSSGSAARCAPPIGSPWLPWLVAHGFPCCLAVRVDLAPVTDDDPLGRLTVVLVVRPAHFLSSSTISASTTSSAPPAAPAAPAPGPAEPAPGACVPSGPGAPSVPSACCCE